MQHNYLEDSQGNKSSKRIWGSILLCAGIVFSSILFAQSLLYQPPDASTSIGIINILLITGVGLLGSCMFERRKSQ